MNFQIIFVLKLCLYDKHRLKRNVNFEPQNVERSIF